MQHIQSLAILLGVVRAAAAAQGQQLELLRKESLEGERPGDWVGWWHHHLPAIAMAAVACSYTCAGSSSNSAQIKEQHHSPPRAQHVGGSINFAKHERAALGPTRSSMTEDQYSSVGQDVLAWAESRVRVSLPLFPSPDA